MSNSNKQFNSVNIKIPRRNRFELGYDRKYSMQMGKLYPCHYEDVVPNSTFHLGGKNLIRLESLISPMMHTVWSYIHYWNVPRRLLWPNFEKFITGGVKYDPEAPLPVYPTVTSPAGTGWAIGSIADYLGLPTGIPNLVVDAMPFAAYDRIIVEWYRNENIQDIEPLMLTDGDNTAAVVARGLFGVPFDRNWERDYFTSCLNETQKGPEVYLPMIENAPLVNISASGDSVIRETLTGFPQPSNSGDFAADALGETRVLDLPNPAIPVQVDVTAHTIADLSSATQVDIRNVRNAFALQKMLERMMLIGTRYVEYLKGFGVRRPSDARFQRPEWLGGGKSAISISEVLQTSSTDATSPQGNMAGHGISAGDSRFSRYFEEHSIIIGLHSIMPKTAYQQGIHPTWSRFERFDWFDPSMAHLGVQPVLNKEIYATGTSADDETFGYQDIYSFMRFKFDTVHGQFRDSLKFWHLGRIFDTAPALNDEFLRADPRRDIFAVTDEEVDTIYVHLYQDVTGILPVPIYGQPAQI